MSETVAMTMPANRMQEMIRDYRRLRSVVPLGTPRTKKDYDRAVASLDAILDEIGEMKNTRWPSLPQAGARLAVS